MSATSSQHTVQSPAVSQKEETGVPRHVAIIMDGNGRWARARGVPVAKGHHEGGEAVQRCVRAAIAQNVPYLTLYAFSSENWRRSDEEVGNLTSLLQFYLRHKLDELDKLGVRLQVIGEPERFGSGLCQELQRAETRTARNTKLTLSLALSYGGRAELARAARNLAVRVQEGLLEPEQITEAVLASALQTSGIPDPDVVARTSGEHRLSNFLLWQSAYAELVFLDVLWPDFGAEDFAEIVACFARRQRRFGGRPQ